MARTFNGTTDYISIANSSVLDGVKFTLSTWFWPATSAIAFPVIAMKEQTSQGWILHIINTTDIKFKINQDDTHALVTSGLNLKMNMWHHIAAGWDGTTLWLYLDGKFIKGQSGSSALTIGNTAVLLGTYFGAPANTFFTGRLAEFRFFNFWVGAEGVYQLSRSTRAWDVFQSNAPYFPLNGDIPSNPEYDYSTNRIPVTLNGTGIAAHPPMLRPRPLSLLGGFTAGPAGPVVNKVTRYWFKR